MKINNQFGPDSIFSNQGNIGHLFLKIYHLSHQSAWIKKCGLFSHKQTVHLGRLDGSSEILPNPDLFVLMYVRKEAVLSSQIEGTQASLMDLLEYEAKASETGGPQDVDEIVNYVDAMNDGLERLKELPFIPAALMRNPCKTSGRCTRK